MTLLVLYIDENEWNKSHINLIILNKYSFYHQQSKNIFLNISAFPLLL
jgi:hypothetical protein